MAALFFVALLFATDAEAIPRYVAQLVRERANDLNERYVGKFTEVDVKAVFPRHRLVVADLTFSHWAPDDNEVEMLLVLDRESGTVVAHCWSPWYADHSASFEEFLRLQSPSSEKAAMAQMQTLADAIASTSETLKVTNVVKDGAGFVATLRHNDRPYRILRVPYDHKNGFGPMTVINAVSGKPVPPVAFQPE